MFICFVILKKYVFLRSLLIPDNHLVLLLSCMNYSTVAPPAL